MGKKLFSKEFFQSLLNKSMKEKITIVVLVGILLLVIVLPINNNNDDTTSSSSNTSQDTSSTDQESYEEYLQEKLQGILAKVDGVGKVQVVVTLKTTSEKVIASDHSESSDSVEESDSAGGTRSSSSSSSSDTNIYYDTTNGSEPYVTMENMPEVEGIIIVAEGGDNGTVASNITSAVEALLDVPAHKIKVLKMS